jgi:hypothetical protein
MYGSIISNYYYGNFTTVTDESTLAQCDDIIVEFKNTCNSTGNIMSGCVDAAYDKYIVDRGLSSRIEPEDTTFDDPIVPGLDGE